MEKTQPKIIAAYIPVWGYFILISTVKSIIQSPIKNFYHNLGCIMLCVLILTDIIVLWRGIRHETSYFVRLGVLIFVTKGKGA